MGAIAVFDYGLWATRYPELAAVSEPLARLYFAETGVYHSNDGAGPVADADQQLTLMNMLTAHIAWLNRTDAAGQPVSPLVGRINSASEGSVSVGTELNVPPGTAQWFALSSYGFSYWNATAGYRTARYRPGPQRYFGPLYAGAGSWRWPL